MSSLAAAPRQKFCDFGLDFWLHPTFVRHPCRHGSALPRQHASSSSQVTFYVRCVATAVACSCFAFKFHVQASQADRVVEPPRHGKRTNRVASSDAASSSVQTESNLVDDTPLHQSAPFVRSRVTRHSRSRASRPRRSLTSYQVSSFKLCSLSCV